MWQRVHLIQGREEDVPISFSFLSLGQRLFGTMYRVSVTFTKPAAIIWSLYFRAHSASRPIFWHPSAHNSALVRNQLAVSSYLLTRSLGFESCPPLHTPPPSPRDYRKTEDRRQKKKKKTPHIPLQQPTPLRPLPIIQLDRPGRVDHLQKASGLQVRQGLREELGVGVQAGHHHPRVDEVELLGERPLGLDVVDLELHVGRDEGRLDGAEIHAQDRALGVLVGEIYGPDSCF